MGNAQSEEGTEVVNGTPSFPFFGGMPSEVKEYLLHFFDAGDLFVLTQVNREWNQRVDGSQL